MAEMRDKAKGAIDTAADKAKGGIDTAADRPKGMTDRAADTLAGNQGQRGGTRDPLKQGAQSAVDTAGEYLGQARDKVKEWAGGAGEGIGQAADRVQHWAEDAYDTAGDKLGDFGKEVTVMIRRYPVPALLVGFGLGL